MSRNDRVAYRQRVTSYRRAELWVIVKKSVGNARVLYSSNKVRIKTHAVAANFKHIFVD